MKPTCKICGANSYGEYCMKHKPRKPIPKRSAKRIEQEKKYSKVRKDYLEVFFTCEVEGCKNQATEIHHKCGRIGDLLTDHRHFLAVCRAHHQYIEEHPEWAKANGYSENRI